MRYTPVNRLQRTSKRVFKKGKESWIHWKMKKLAYVLQFGLKPENLFLNIEKVKRRLEQFNVLFFQNL